MGSPLQTKSKEREIHTLRLYSPGDDIPAQVRSVQRLPAAYSRYPESCFLLHPETSRSFLEATVRSGRTLVLQLQARRLAGRASQLLLALIRPLTAMWTSLPLRPIGGRLPQGIGVVGGIEAQPWSRNPCHYGVPMLNRHDDFADRPRQACELRRGPQSSIQTYRRRDGDLISSPHSALPNSKTNLKLWRCLDSDGGHQNLALGLD